MTKTLEQGKDEVAKLCEYFKTNQQFYREPRVKEAHVRQSLIDPFFEALGWDVCNRARVAPQYREVVPEDSLDVEGSQKAPDYTFRVGQTPKFYAEAKKCGVNINADTSPAYQLRRYGFSAKLPLSVLTDFEELAVYDCTLRPRPSDKASRGRILYLGFEEYPDHWQEIWDVFSRDAVWSGKFDQYAASKRKRGTSEVDNEFLKDIEEWRDALARNIALRNKKLSVDDLNVAVQRIIDRIVFLRMAEDRGLEPYGQLLELCLRPNVYSRFASKLCRKADEKYNSGLFHFQKESGVSEAPDTLTPRLVVDDKVLKPILQSLYFEHGCPYHFGAMPVEILGTVYERFLGKVIRLTPSHQAKVEEKPEVRKAGGVYYTPAYIVDYIVRQTVGRQVEDRSPSQLAGTKASPPFRVLDMACGSGSFLLGAYQFLLDHSLKWYQEHPSKKHSRAVYDNAKGEITLTIAERKRVLTTHIFGVDIDGQAVETTKLSLLLKALEGEDESTLSQQMLLFHDRALPNLSDNIKCGNSLIGPDYFSGNLIPDPEEIKRVNPFDWDAEFPDAMKAGGFDCVIGNPPYVRIQRIPHGQADYLYRIYKSPTSKTDLSLLFMEKALSLTKEMGNVGFISTSQWLTTDYGRNLRSMLSDGRLHRIVSFGSLPVFESAQTYPAIFILSPTPSKALSVTTIDSKTKLNLKGIEEASSSEIEFGGLSAEPWNLGSLDLTQILERNRIPWKPLKELGGAFIGLLTGMDEAFVVDANTIEVNSLEKDLLYPYAYRGAEITRYSPVNPDSFVIYPYKEGKSGSPELIAERELKVHFPSIYAHLSHRRETLRKRMDSRKLYASGESWYRHLRPGTFNYIKPAKLVIKGVELKASVGLLGQDTAFNGANCPGIILDPRGNCSSYYIMGLLNSKLITYYLRMVCPAKLNGYRRVNSRNLNATPIRLICRIDTAEAALYDELVILVEAMLSLHKHLAKAKSESEKTVLQRQIDSTDAEIDRLVYELYGLTEEEIKIVEGESEG